MTTTDRQGALHDKTGRYAEKVATAPGPDASLATPILSADDAAYWDGHTSDGRCKYPETCQEEGRHADLNERLTGLIAAYDEEPHSEECGFGPCVRCVVDEFAALRLHAPARVDDRECRTFGQHVAATRHARRDCPVGND